MPDEQSNNTPQAPPVQREFPVDTSKLSTVYANFVRATWTPEELVLDFGLNTTVAPNPKDPVALTHRLVLNFYTAKRLMGLMGMAIQQHERVYGVLETDVGKRARPPSRLEPWPGPQPGES